jgi:hypothetical protein
MRKIIDWFKEETVEKVISCAFIAFIIFLLSCSVAHAQTITVYYKTCDSVRLTAEPAPTYLWSTGQTTRSIVLTQTDTTQLISCNGVIIKEPATPAIIQDCFAYQNGVSWTLVDWNYTGLWKIEYLHNGQVLNPTSPTWLQWQVFKAGVYYIKEQRNGCKVKTKIVIQ